MILQRAHGDHRRRVEQLIRARPCAGQLGVGDDEARGSPRWAANAPRPDPPRPRRRSAPTTTTRIEKSSRLAAVAGPLRESVPAGSSLCAAGLARSVRLVRAEAASLAFVPALLLRGHTVTPPRPDAVPQRKRQAPWGLASGKRAPAFSAQFGTQASGFRAGTRWFPALMPRRRSRAYFSCFVPSWRAARRGRTKGEGAAPLAAVPHPSSDSE